MYAMQYTISLPADYDMHNIRERVRMRGTSLDAFPGPAVQHWTGVSFVRGPAIESLPQVASIRTDVSSGD